MRFHESLLASALLLMITGACGSNNVDVVSAEDREKRPSAMARLQDPSGEQVGVAKLTGTPNGVLIRVEFNGLASGPHALHLHEQGKCEGPDFASAGKHFMSAEKNHGFKNPEGPHAGDLPNFKVPESGKVTVEMLNDRVTLEAGEPNSLLRSQGASLVVHSGADDYRTDPAGNSGTRIACGVIEPSSK